MVLGGWPEGGSGGTYCSAGSGVATGVVGPSLPPQAASTANAAMLSPRASGLRRKTESDMDEILEKRATGGARNGVPWGDSAPRTGGMHGAKPRGLDAESVPTMP